MTAVAFTLKSRNGKVGPMPVSTTSANTCPPSCPLQGMGCYAKSGPLGMIWADLSKAEPGEAVKRGRGTMQTLTWDQFTHAVAALPTDTLWRHNQAGDLPGEGDTIDIVALAALVDANAGKRGFTYTHKPLNARNAAAVTDANARGFTINLSADNVREADELAATNAGPVVVVLPEELGRKAKGDAWLETEAEYRARVDVQGIKTPEGRKVAPCPATYLDTSCLDCGLCAKRDRKVIVGFPAHGASKKKASAVAAS